MRLRRACRSVELPEFSLIAVYRTDNAPILGRVVDAALECGASVHLWALDEPASQLARWTLGAGPGMRFEILNRLAKAAHPGGGILVVDDDVTFVHGTVNDLVKCAVAAGLEIAAPTHSLDSHASHPFTVSRSGTVARLTTFVEIGPVVWFDRSCRRVVMPFPEDGSMGWGTELDWAESGCRLGLVDAVRIRHLSPAGHGYSSEADQRRLQDALHERSYQSLREIQQELARWSATRPRPPWPIEGDGSRQP